MLLFMASNNHIEQVTIIYNLAMLVGPASDQSLSYISISILYIFLQSIYYFTRPRALTGDEKFVIVHETIELYSIQEDSTIRL